MSTYLFARQDQIPAQGNMIMSLPSSSKVIHTYLKFSFWGGEKFRGVQASCGCVLKTCLWPYGFIRSERNNQCNNIIMKITINMNMTVITLFLVSIRDWIAYFHVLKVLRKAIHSAARMQASNIPLVVLSAFLMALLPVSRNNCPHLQHFLILLFYCSYCSIVQLQLHNDWWESDHLIIWGWFRWGLRDVAMTSLSLSAIRSVFCSNGICFLGFFWPACFALVRLRRYVSHCEHLTVCRTCICSICL